MTTTRTPITPPQNVHITARAVVLYKHILSLLDDGREDVWEEDGGTQREFSNTKVELHVLLGRKPWQAPITDTTALMNLRTG